MDLVTDVRLPFPPETVFTIFRDEVAHLEPYLPGIQSIEVVSRAEHDGLVDLVVDWQSGADVPAFVRGLIGESKFAWTDYATWDEGALAVDWRTETVALGGALRCGARDVFLEDGPGRTLLQIRGAIDIDPAKIPGVPALLGGAVGPRLEAYLVKRVCASLGDTAAALALYLEGRDPLHSKVS